MNWKSMSAKTAINRKEPSSPIKFLCKNGLIAGRVLHSGRGRDVLGTELLKECSDSVDEYDPTYCPNTETFQEVYDVVVQCYVLNTLPVDSDDFNACLNQLRKNTSEFGVCYIAVMGNSYSPKGENIGNGVITKRGTFQNCLKKKDWIEILEKYFGRVYFIKEFGTRDTVLFQCNIRNGENE